VDYEELLEEVYRFGEYARRVVEKVFGEEYRRLI